MEKLFEKATRNKVRFEFRGLISAEDLWDLNVEELDSIYKKLNVEKRQTSEESLLETKTTENTLLTMKMDIVKYIVEYKLKQANDAMLRLEKKEKKEKILSILAAKQDNALENMSEKKLKEMLESL